MSSNLVEENECVVNGLLVTGHGFPDALGRDYKIPPKREEIDKCKQWIKKWIKKQKTINRKADSHNSYGLKCILEEMESKPRKPVYISNGAFIVAAVELGYEVEPCDFYSPNAVFNMDFEYLHKSYTHE